MDAGDLERLWDAAPASRERRIRAQLPELPDAASLYLGHAIARGAPPVDAGRLRMHGEIRLGGWVRFEAEQVIRRGRGMVWRARTRAHGLPVRGFDRIVDGRGEMRWKLLGLVPVLSRSGPDIDRSAAGRLAAELVWLPSALAGAEVRWTQPAPGLVAAEFEAQGFPHHLRLVLRDDGSVAELRTRRWGDPEGGAFREEEFGGVVEDETRFGDFTIPSRLRIGWHPGTERFAADGEFIRVTVTRADYR